MGNEQLAAIRFDHVRFSYAQNKTHRANKASSKTSSAEQGTLQLDVHLDIPQGSITALIGPNGSGKSTLIKLIDGLLKPHAGQVLLADQGKQLIPTLSFRPKKRARTVAVLPQMTIAPSMTVEEVVTSGRYPYQNMQGMLSARDKAKVDEALVITGLERLRYKNIQTLSGGERQRAYIAMVVAQDTDLVVLDEPTTYLDIHTSHDIMKLVRKLNREAGKTVVMVIHDIDLALRYSDEVIVMKRGRVQAQAPVDSILETNAIQQAFSVNIHPATIEGDQAFVLIPRHEKN